MSDTLYTLGLFVVLPLSYFLYSLWTSLSHRWRARQLGCQPAFIRPCRLPFGLDIMQRYSKQAALQTVLSDELLLYEELGRRPTWNQNVLGNWQHITADPQNVQAILAKQFKDFSLGPIRRGAFEPLIGHGIFTSDGEYWERSRALLRPQFTRGQIADLALEETHVQHLLKRIPTGTGSWTSKVDLAPLFFNLTLDSATEFLFGESALTQLAPLREKASHKHGNQTGNSGSLDWSSFGKYFDSANAVVEQRGRLFDFYFLYKPSSFKNDCHQVHRHVDHVVDRALSRSKESKRELDEKSSRYIFLDELVKHTQDRKELRSQLLNILLAGRDTTAGLLGWTFYYLARDPALYDKLRKIVIEAFGTDISSITFETLKSCAFLQNTMRETLRLEPLVPANSRRAVRNTTLPRGGGPDGESPIYIRAGEEVGYNVFVMHRRKDIWGEDADEYKPERWEGLKNGWEYLPFNGGPRICIGQQFALTEAGYVLVRLLQKYDKIENLDPEVFTKRKYTATTSPVQVLLRLHEAEE